MARPKPLEAQGVFQMKAARSLLAAFHAYTQQRDLTASQVLRAFMRQCLEQGAKEPGRG